MIGLWTFHGEATTDHWPLRGANPSTGLRFEVSRALESQRDVVAAVSNRVSVSGQDALVSAYGYENDAVGRRTGRVDWVSGSAAATNRFVYNRRGELTNAVMSGSQYGFAYDQLGNRTASATNGVASAYTANELNQILQRTQGATTNLFRYDADGNLTNDGARAYAWDGENRLASAVKAGETKTEYVYDYMGRRCGKKTYQWQNGAWVLTEERTFLYDGWNLIREQAKTVATSAVTTNYYTWGLDLSGSSQGAGGIGGLVASTRASATATRTLLHAYDANGNLGQSVDASDGSLKASYQYDPYGNVAAQSGDLAGENPFRFSTKYCDDETGMSYYGHRYYAPEVGRWVQRDPIQEDGGVALYLFVANAPILSVDALGLKDQVRLINNRNQDIFTFLDVEVEREAVDIRTLGQVDETVILNHERRSRPPRRAICQIDIRVRIQVDPRLLPWQSLRYRDVAQVIYYHTPSLEGDEGYSVVNIREPTELHEQGHIQDIIDAWPEVKQALRKYLGGYGPVGTAEAVDVKYEAMSKRYRERIGTARLKVNVWERGWYLNRGFKPQFVNWTGETKEKLDYSYQLEPPRRR